MKSEDDWRERASAALKRRTARDGRPILIGIGGGSAAGKSTIAREMAHRLEPFRVEVMCQDRFFHPRDELPRYPSELRSEPWPDYNRPETVDVDRMVAWCRDLDGADVAILEGILALHFPEARELMDLKLYVTADADERIVRRIRRNLPRSSIDDIADYYLESVRYQHERYNAPTERHADLVIPGGMHDGRRREAMLACICDEVLRVRGLA